MPRKIYYEHRKHFYVRTNSYAQSVWLDERDINGKAPYAPNWSIPRMKPLLHRGRKP